MRSSESKTKAMTTKQSARRGRGNPHGLTAKHWAAIQRAASKLHPKTAIWWCHYVEVLDVYGVDKKLTPECVGNECFVRSPGSKVWIYLGDLPASTQEALLKEAERRDRRSKADIIYYRRSKADGKYYLVCPLE